MPSLFTKRLLFHVLLIVLLSFNMASHTRGLWPGDGWFGRSGYWISRFTIESVLFLGSYYLLSVLPAQLSTWFRLLLAVLISWPVFVLA